MNIHSVDFRGVAQTFKAAMLLGSSGASDAAPGGGGGPAAADAAAAGDGSRRREDSGGGGGGGAAFAVSSIRQLNSAIVVSRGLALPADPDAAQEALRCVAAYVAGGAGYAFPAGSRACRGYMPL